MNDRLVDTPEVQTLLDKLSGQDTNTGDPRLKAIIPVLLATCLPLSTSSTYPRTSSGRPSTM